MPQDIGGGWALDDGEESPLSHVPLVWMVREAQRAGLQFDLNKLRALNCCPEEQEWDDNDNNDVDVDGAEDTTTNNKDPTTTAAAPPAIQISAATPPLDSRSHSYLGNPNPSPNANSNLTPSPLSPSSTPSPTHFHALLHLSATTGKLHDVLRLHNGAPALSVLSWNLMEWIPFRRMDLAADGSWRSIAWPLPKGEVRDVPPAAVVHHSALRRMRADEGYRPGNLILGGGGRGVRRAPVEAGVGRWRVWGEEGDVVGEVWVRD